MVKKVKTKDGAGASEATVAAVPTKNKIVKSAKASADGKKVKPVKNGTDANTNGTAKGLKKAQNVKVEENDVVPQTEEHVAVPAKKKKPSKTPAAEAADDSVVSKDEVPEPVAEVEPEKSAENGKENKLKRKKKTEKNDASVEENGNGEAVPVKKAKSDNKKITAGTTIDKVPGIKTKLTNQEEHAMKKEEQNKIAKQKELLGVLNYLDIWKNHREKWKFQKLKQLYIQDHVFDEKKFNAKNFSRALEYLAGAKGKSLSNMLVSAKLIIKEIDSASDADENAKKSVKYQRAREILQTLG